MSESGNTQPPTSKEKRKAPRSAFKKGDERINLTGRPKVFRDELRKLVGEHGGKAYELIWAIAQGELSYEEVESRTRPPPDFIPDAADLVEEKRSVRVPSFQVRLDAAKFLAEQLNGKAVQSMELTATKIEARVDLRRLSDAELEAFEQLQTRALVVDGEVTKALP